MFSYLMHPHSPPGPRWNICRKFCTHYPTPDDDMLLHHISLMRICFHSSFVPYTNLLIAGLPL
jgi:hypothetical protein